MQKQFKNPFPALRFKPAREFAFRRELRKQVLAHMNQHEENRYADSLLYLKGIFLAAIVASTYLFALKADTTLQFVCAYVTSLFMAMGLAMNILHDAAHHALCRTGFLNRIVMRLTSIPVGIDTDYWSIRHVYFHHTYANVEGYDLDIEPNAFLRQTPFHQWSPHYRYQHLYWPLVAALSLPYLNWFSDWADRFGKTQVSSHSNLTNLRGWLTFISFKLMHVTVILALPMWVLHDKRIGWGIVLAAYFIGQMLASCFLVAMILGTHWAEVEFFQADVDGKLPHNWYEHAFLTCCDWLPKPTWLGYWLGGLNLHLTHHLFPTYSHRHYPQLAKIVARVAGEHDLKYRNLNYRQLLVSQQCFLKSMGRGVRI
jgi:linoleoyl-CoA desaturase